MKRLFTNAARQLSRDLLVLDRLDSWWVFLWIFRNIFIRFSNRSQFFFPQLNVNKEVKDWVQPSLTTAIVLFFFFRLSIKCDGSFCQQQRPNVSLTTAESVTKALTFLPVEEELSVIRVIFYHCAVILLWQLSRAPRKGQGLNEPLKQGSHRSLMDLFSCVSKYWVMKMRS